MSDTKYGFDVALLESVKKAGKKLDAEGGTKENWCALLRALIALLAHAFDRFPPPSMYWLRCVRRGSKWVPLGNHMRNDGVKSHDGLAISLSTIGLWTMGKLIPDPDTEIVGGTVGGVEATLSGQRQLLGFVQQEGMGWRGFVLGWLRILARTEKDELGDLPIEKPITLSFSAYSIEDLVSSQRFPPVDVAKLLLNYVLEYARRELDELARKKAEFDGAHSLASEVEGVILRVDGLSCLECGVLVTRPSPECKAVGKHSVTA